MSDAVLGVVFGELAAAAFALNTVLIRIGMRTRRDDDGILTTLLVNAVCLGAVVVTIGRFSVVAAALPGFLIAGLAHSWLARSFTYRSVRLIGPSRAGLVQLAAPVMAAALGWLFLDETMGVLQAVGGLITVVGIATVVLAPLPIPSFDDGHHHTRRGYTAAILAAVFFAAGFVARRWALLEDSAPAVGALIGIVAALVTASAISTVGERRRRDAAAALRRPSLWFLGAGLAASFALAVQFLSSTYTQAWIATVLHGTQALWVLFWSRTLLGGEEGIGVRLVASFLLISFGVALAVS